MMGRAARLWLRVAVTAVCGWVAVTGLPATAASGTAAARFAALAQELEELVTAGAITLNTSISLGVVDFRSGELITVARGVDDRVTGAEVDADSMYPVGSVTKTFLTVSGLRAAESGKLDLDAPVLPILDPWLSQRGYPEIASLWASEPESLAMLRKVTARQLLSMQSGIPDYDDDLMQRWTKENPTKDFSPFDYLRNVSKTLRFPPGNGTEYSSNGYVVMGLLLAAVADVESWEAFDQWGSAGLGAVKPPLNHTRFMLNGPCSLYPRVVHQYGLVPPPESDSALNSEPTATVLHASAVGTGSRVGARGWAWWREPASLEPLRKLWDRDGLDKCDGQSEYHGKVSGHVAIVFPNVNTSECCTVANSWANKAGVPAMWVSEGGNCSVFDHMWGYNPAATATLGHAGPPPAPPKPLSPSDIYDLYDESCLNGWTMGNIAASAGDIARFYHQLFTYKLLSPSSVEAMTRWHNFTTGWGGTGMLYGMGLIQMPTGVIRDALGVPTNATFIVGHPGADWGSNMMTVGYYPHLNFSIALGTNSEVPLNFTQGVYRNAGMETPASVELTCRIEDALMRYATPSHVGLMCKEK